MKRWVAPCLVALIYVVVYLLLAALFKDSVIARCVGAVCGAVAGWLTDRRLSYLSIAAAVLLVGLVLPTLFLALSWPSGPGYDTHRLLALVIASEAIAVGVAMIAAVVTLYLLNCASRRSQSL